MIHHVTLHVSNYEKAKEFFSKTLKPLGYEKIMDFPEYKAAGFGKSGKPDFWIAEKNPFGNQHVAISAENQEQIGRFYEAAIKAGAKDNGAPGFRKEYSPDYYAAFILDSDGNNIEAVLR